MKIFTLVLVLRKPQILLGLKKRGFGEGKWNGFGGKVEFGESVIQAAIRLLHNLAIHNFKMHFTSKFLSDCRELNEESGIVADECNLFQQGIIKMDFSNGEDPFRIHVFQCNDYKEKITETEGSFNFIIISFSKKIG